MTTDMFLFTYSTTPNGITVDGYYQCGPDSWINVDGMDDKEYGVRVLLSYFKDMSYSVCINIDGQQICSKEMQVKKGTGYVEFSTFLNGAKFKMSPNRMMSTNSMETSNQEVGKITITVHDSWKHVETTQIKDFVKPEINCDTKFWDRPTHYTIHGDHVSNVPTFGTIEVCPALHVHTFRYTTTEAKRQRDLPALEKP